MERIFVSAVFLALGGFAASFQISGIWDIWDFAFGALTFCSIVTLIFDEVAL